MIYIGIDLSLTGTGIVVLDEQGNVLDKDLITTKPSSAIEDRIEKIFFLSRNIIVDAYERNAKGGSELCIEGLSYGSKSSSMLELAGLHYFLRHQLQYNIQIVLEPIIVPPQTLKKWVCGKGTAKKEQMLLQTYKRWGMEFQDNNICDAYCLARYAMENDAIRE